MSRRTVAIFSLYVTRLGEPYWGKGNTCFDGQGGPVQPDRVVRIEPPDVRCRSLS